MTTPEAATSPEQEEEIEVIAVVSLVFLPDGSIKVQSSGLKANQAWAAAGMLRNLGDEMWADARAEQKAAVRHADPRSRLMVPGRG